MNGSTQKPRDVRPQVEPHSFRPLKLWDLRSGGRCIHCLLAKNAHPIHYWAPARPYGDKSKAELTWEAREVLKALEAKHD